MKIVTYTVGNGPRMGFFNSTGEWVYPLSAAGMDYKDMKTLVKEICGPEIQMAEYVAGKSPYEIPGAAQLGEEMCIRDRPSTVKGAYLKSVTLTSTMGPGVKLNVAKLTN